MKGTFYVVEQTEETTDNPNVSVTGAPQSKPEATKSSTSCTSSKTLVTCSLPSDVHFKLIDNLFPDTDINEVHHHLLCINQNCTGFSKVEKNRQSHLKEKFDHTWLSEKSLSFCEVTRIWNVVFIEGFGIYCLLCKKHNTKNNRNKSMVFSEVPSTHFRKVTLTEHISNKHHTEAKSCEAMNRISACR